MKIQIGLLVIGFVILKLIGVIDWSWWLVLLPFYLVLMWIVFMVTWLIVYYKLTRRKKVSR